MRAITIVFMALLACGSWAVSAQDEQQGSQRDTRKTPAIREPVYRQLSEAQQAAEDERYQAALEMLGSLRQDDSLNSYERAQMWNIHAYIHIAREDYENAIRAYENLLAQDNLPLGLEGSSRYSLAQLYFTTERYREAAQTLESWFEYAENPAPSTYILLANSYYSLEEYERAVQPVERAIELARSKGEAVKEHWWQLLRAIHYELGDLERVAEILELLVTRFPKREYWMQLASVYARLEQPANQLRALDLAYEQGLLTGERELVNFAQLLLQQEIPYRAAKVLQRGMDEGVVERDVRNLRLLAQAYRAAKEESKALEPLREAASRSGDGKLYMQLAYAHSNLNQWAEAAEAASQALSAGGLDRPDQAQLFRGTALFNADRFEAALEAFRAAARDERSARQARQWLDFVQKEINRREQLADIM